MSNPWRELKNADGRPYYHNTATNKTQWEKPAELMGAGEKDVPWKEYTTPEGRKYWAHKETRQTTWEMPQEVKDAMAAQSNGVPQRPPAATFVAGSGPSFHQPQQHRERDRDDYSHYDRHQSDRPQSHPQHDGTRSAFVPASANEPEYATFEEAEGAFLKVLKRAGVQPDWTWEQTMKAAIGDPQYRALKDPKERKAAYEKYIIEARLQDKEREKERLAKLRDDFQKMLKTHPEIKHYTRWKTARPIIEGETMFKAAGNDDERRQLFGEYIIGLKEHHAESEASNRKAALEELSNIFRSLDLEPYTRWSDAQSMIDRDERVTSDEKFKSLSKLDVLRVFEGHIKSLERTFNDAKQTEKTHRGRNERQNRDQFTVLLKDLRSAGKIRAGAKWMDVQPLIEDDPRYIAMLGQTGSTPLDIFWDVVEDEELALRSKRLQVLDALDDGRFEMTAKSTLDEYMQVVTADPRTSSFHEHDLALIFHRLQDKIARRDAEEKHAAERHQRRAVDALRSRIKHLDPPVHTSDTWEQVRPRLERYPEFTDLKSDDLRRSAFDKAIRRLQEKEAEAEYDRSSRRGGDRDREHRRRPTSKHEGSRYSRTPEPDAYEADRRKAQADRERQYRKASSGSGLSPPPAERDARRRDRDDRELYDARHPGRLNSFDRGSYRDEARRPPPRDLDTDRAYLSRADPRDVGRELDYGDGGRAGSMASSNGRKRRDSEDSDRKDSKRLKRDRRSRTPREPTPMDVKEEENLKSGSEEGEIEEA